MSTLKDIADSLGVTVSTVSRALSGSGRISEATIKRVREEAEKMGYYPNESARILKTGQSSMIGVLAPDITDKFYSRLLKSISREAAKSGFGVLYCDTGGDLCAEKNYYNMLRSKNVSGILIAATGENHIYDAEDTSGIIFIDNLPHPKADVCCISIDHEKAGYELTEHLIKNGHRDIAVITGSMIETSASERLSGHLACLKKYGISKALVYHGDYRFSGGYNAVSEMLKDGLPSAIIAHNHLLAYGAVAALKEKSFEIPKNVKLACFDIVDETNIFAPKMTYMISPVDELGSEAARMMIEKITSGTDFGGRIFLAHTLIER
ncbi:MAG: LacI family DNA-binding transcriptional regulator [Christensenellaceae bacterium]|nr:LacI family DNA-binding transcriptional regulator [Christensenellaceae bacterium]